MEGSGGFHDAYTNSMKHIYTLTCRHAQPCPLQDMTPLSQEVQRSHISPPGDFRYTLYLPCECKYPEDKK